MQFLIEGKDKSLSIVYKKSIIVEDLNMSLAVGDTVKFLYPENTKKPKQFSGSIIAKDHDEEVLLGIKQSIVESWESEKKRGLRRKANNDKLETHATSKSKLESKNDSEDLREKKRQKPVTLLEKEIMNKIQETNHSQKLEEKPGRKSQVWLLDVIKDLKQDFSVLTSTAEKILTKIDFLETSLSSDDDFIIPKNARVADHKSTAEVQRRSYGMPLTLENENMDFAGENSTSNLIDSTDSVGNKNSQQNDIPGLFAKEDRSDHRSTNTEVVDLTSDDSYSEKSHESSYEIKEAKIKQERKDLSEFDDFSDENYESMMHEKMSSPQPSTSYTYSTNFQTKKRYRSVYYDEEDEGNANKIENESKKHKKIDREVTESETKSLIDKNKNTLNSDEDNDNQEKRSDLNTEWTLKFTTKIGNVSELMTGSNIFVNIIDLKTITDTCKNQNEMARALLKAVFTEDALRKCSLSGKKPTVQSKTKIVKPGLNMNGVNVILLYVQSFAKKMNWKPKDRQTILRSMGAKLFEMSE